MLTKSEEKIEVKNKRTGRSYFVYKKISGRRNEALDCRVGNMVTLKSVNPNLETLRDQYLRIAESIKNNNPIVIKKSGRRIRSRGI